MDKISGFDLQKFSWLHNPTSWQPEIVETQRKISDNSEVEGFGGSYSVTDDCSKLLLSAPAKKDFWSRTFYEPLLIKNDASALLCSVPTDADATIKVDFLLTPKAQFDQAGLMVYLDNLHWIKCGIEYCDGTARLSVVVCNNYSDWSTQSWPTMVGAGSQVLTTGARLKLHKRCHSSSIVVEAAPLDTEEFQFIRIAHCSVQSTHVTVEPNQSVCSPSAVPWRVGPYAACPVKQIGCSATFWHFSAGPLERTCHDAVL